MPASAISLPASPRQPLPLDAATERAWHAAARRTPQLDPFCCRSEWQLAFHEVFAPERSLLFAGDDDSCVVFARVPLRTGTLLAPIDTSWQFGCPLLGPAALDVLDLQLRYGSGSATTNLLISALEPDGPLLRDLHARSWARLGEPMVREYRAAQQRRRDEGLRRGGITRAGGHELLALPAQKARLERIALDARDARVDERPHLRDRRDVRIRWHS